MKKHGESCDHQQAFIALRGGTKTIEIAYLHADLEGVVATPFWGETNELVSKAT